MGYGVRKIKPDKFMGCGKMFSKWEELFDE